MDNIRKMWILFELKDAQEDLARIIKDLENEPDYDEVEYRIDVAHLYHHVNSAWNARNATTEAIEIEGKFDEWRQFPTDIEPL